MPRSRYEVPTGLPSLTVQKNVCPAHSVVLLTDCNNSFRVKSVRQRFSVRCLWTCLQDFVRTAVYIALVCVGKFHSKVYYVRSWLSSTNDRRDPHYMVDEVLIAGNECAIGKRTCICTYFCTFGERLFPLNVFQFTAITYLMLSWGTVRFSWFVVSSDVKSDKALRSQMLVIGDQCKYSVAWSTVWRILTMNGFAHINT